LDWKEYSVGAGVTVGNNVAVNKGVAVRDETGEEYLSGESVPDDG
jgi:hypothetical protein